MRRIFWDSMLFIYLLEGQGAARERAVYLLKTAKDRNDLLFTSCLVLGEVLAGAKVSPEPKALLIRDVVREMGFSFLSFDLGAVDAFGTLRSRTAPRVRIADAINLACAASAGMDMFLTNDSDLFKLHVPGISFVADFNNPAL